MPAGTQVEVCGELEKQNEAIEETVIGVGAEENGNEGVGVTDSFGKIYSYK